MLMRSDPFRELDRVTQQLFTGTQHPATAMPMDAWREDGAVWVKFDLPGVDPDTVDLKVERDVLTVQAERKPAIKESAEVIISERPPARSPGNCSWARPWTPSTSRPPTRR